MAIVEVTYETVLQFAQQLAPKEQAQLIGQLAQNLVAAPEPPAVNDQMMVMKEIRERLRQSGYTPRTPEEVVAYIEAERDSWGD